MSKEVPHLLVKDRTCSLHTTTLGEIEPVADKIAAISKNKKVIYYDVDTPSLPAFSTSLEYLIKKQDSGIELINVMTDEQSLDGINDPVFIFSCKLKKSYPYPYERINKIFIYKIEK
jgi:hypothetical protein